MSTTEEAERSSIEGGIMSTPSLDGVNHSITTHDLDLDHGTSAPFFVAPPTDETCVPNQISAAASAADGPNGDDNPFPLPAFGLASTGTGGGLPSVDETRRININELIAELNSANGSGNINLRELETIMISKEAAKKEQVEAEAEGRASEELPFSLPPPPSGPELIHDNVGPLNPLATLDSGPGYMIKMKERKGFLEQIHDNDGPPDLTEMLSTIEDSDIAKKINDGQAIHSAAGDHELGLKPKANELSPPVPFNLIKARFNNNCVQNQQREDDSVYIPTRDEIETDDTEPFAITRTPSTVRRRGADSREMIENNPAVSDGDIENASAGVGGALDRAIVHERDPNGSLQIIPEAFLVEENDHGVISGYAEPLLPWWRQKRTKLLLVLVFIIVTIMSVVIGLSPSWSSSQPDPEQIFITKTYPPTSSAVPTMEQSNPPSLSTIPSYSPTACSYTISTGIQKLDMPLESLYRPNVAIDGRNMVVAARDSNGKR